MKRLVVLTAALLAVCLAASGCQGNREEVSSSPVTSQAPASASEPASSLPETESSSSSSRNLTLEEQFQEQLAELRHGLSLTNPDSPEHGRMNNGFVGIQTQVYDEGNLHMEYPVVSDNRFIPDELPYGKVEEPGYFDGYVNIRESLKEAPFLFLKKYDLESEGTSLDLTYKVILFDPSALYLDYYGTYTSATGEKIPAHFISTYGCGSGETEETGKYISISSYVDIPYYILSQSEPYTIQSDDPSKQKAAEEYIQSLDFDQLYDLLMPIYYPKEHNIGSMEDGDYPKGYYYCKDSKLITMVEVPAEYGYWITLTFEIEDLMSYSDWFGANINPNWDGSSS